MSAFWIHFDIEFRHGLRNRNMLLMNYLFPLGFYVAVGGLMAQLNPYFRPNIVPAMVTFAALAGTALGLPNPLVAARENGVFRSFKVNGVPAASILLIPALSTILHVVVSSTIIAATARPLFHAPVPVDWAGFALFVLLTAFALTGLGLLIGVIAANVRATILWSQLLFLSSILLGGLMVPSGALPPAFRRVGLLLPTSYAVSVYRSLARRSVGSLPLTWSLLVLLSSGTLCFLLAAYLFNWDRQNATRRGHPLMALLALTPYIFGAILL